MGSLLFPLWHIYLDLILSTSFPRPDVSVEQRLTSQPTSVAKVLGQLLLTSGYVAPRCSRSYCQHLPCSGRTTLRGPCGIVCYKSLNSRPDQCLWELVVPPKMTVNLTISTYRSLYVGDGCKHNGLLVAELTKGSRCDGFVQIDRLCGFSKNKMYISSSNHFLILLDDRIGWEMTEFSATYSAHDPRQGEHRPIKPGRPLLGKAEADGTVQSLWEFSTRALDGASAGIKVRADVRSCEKTTTITAYDGPSTGRTVTACKSHPLVRSSELSEELTGIRAGKVNPSGSMVPCLHRRGYNVVSPILSRVDCNILDLPTAITFEGTVETMVIVVSSAKNSKDRIKFTSENTWECRPPQCQEVTRYITSGEQVEKISVQSVPSVSSRTLIAIQLLIPDRYLKVFFHRLQISGPSGSHCEYGEILVQRMNTLCGNATLKAWEDAGEEGVVIKSRIFLIFVRSYSPLTTFDVQLKIEAATCFGYMNPCLAGHGCILELPPHLECVEFTYLPTDRFSRFHERSLFIEYSTAEGSRVVLRINDVPIMTEEEITYLHSSTADCNTLAITGHKTHGLTDGPTETKYVRDIGRIKLSRTCLWLGIWMKLAIRRDRMCSDATICCGINSHETSLRKMESDFGDLYSFAPMLCSTIHLSQLSKFHSSFLKLNVHRHECIEDTCGTIAIEMLIAKDNSSQDHHESRSSYAEIVQSYLFNTAETRYAWDLMQIPDQATLSWNVVNPPLAAIGVQFHGLSIGTGVVRLRYSPVVSDVESSESFSYENAVHPGASSWEQAHKICQDKGMQLPVVNQDVKWQQLLHFITLMNEPEISLVFLGLRLVSETTNVSHTVRNAENSDGNITTNTPRASFWNNVKLDAEIMTKTLPQIHLRIVSGII